MGSVFFCRGVRLAPGVPARSSSGPANTFRCLFGGKGNPSASAGGAPLLPKPPIPSPARFYRGRAKDTRHSRPKSKRRVYSQFGLSIEIVCKNCVDRPWSIFRVKRFALQAIWPVASGENVVFRSVGAGRRCAAPFQASFDEPASQWRKASRMAEGWRVRGQTA